MLRHPFLLAAILLPAPGLACAPPAVATPMAVEIPEAPRAPEAPRSDEPVQTLGPKASTGALTWSSSEVEALARARREHRPLLVAFTAEWDGASAELNRHTFTDPGLEGELRRFVLAKVDVTNDEDTMVDAIKARYGVVGLPTIVVLDSSGKERARIVELIEPEALRLVLAPIR